MLAGLVAFATSSVMGDWSSLSRFSAAQQTCPLRRSFAAALFGVFVRELLALLFLGAGLLFRARF